MSTGLLIRNFHKQDRELRYSDSGSIRFSEIEHNAYRLSLTLEITHIDAPRYGNKKTLPDNTHYGYVTIFKGSTVADMVSIKYPKFRVFDIINQGIWNHHQHTESLQTETLVSSQSTEAAARGILERIGGVADTTVCVVWRFLDFLGEDFVDKFVYNVFGCNDPDLPENGRELEQYRAFPVASPFPTVIKFKSDVPVSFLWRLEAWYLKNPLVYIVDNPTDTSDITDGEDEYPEPESGDGDGDGSEFPPSDMPDSDSDPRDFSDRDSNVSGVGGWLAYEFIDFAGVWRPGIQGGATFGYPGGIQCRPGEPSAYSMWYVWEGGERLIVASGSPTAVRSFRVQTEENGETLYNILGQINCG